MKTTGCQSSAAAHERTRPTVVVADDHRRMLDAVSNLLADDFRLVAAVTDGRQAVDAVSRLDPDVAVLDITMPELDGFHAAEELRRRGSQAKVIFLTVNDDEDYVAAALESGGVAYVLKSRMYSDLMRAISAALAGEIFISPRTI